MKPTFLEFDDLIEIQQHLIETYGGLAGLRDTGLLQSALAMPQSMFGGAYLHKDLYEMAAAYLFHIVKNHPFADGNKRAGTSAAIVFLEMNDLLLQVDQDVLSTFVIEVVEGKHEKPAIAEFFRKHCVNAN